MPIRWKFWRRTGNTKPTQLQEPVLPPATVDWLPLFSARELLGLQRVIGNRAVLELLALKKAQSTLQEEFAKKPVRSFSWRKARRN